MKRCVLWSALILVIVFSSIVSADSPTGTIQLDLNKPPVVEAQDEDPVLAKYNEVMQEISISDEAAEVVENIRAAIAGIKTITMDVDVTEIREQRIERIFVHLLASVEHVVARIEFLEPSAMRGQILVAEQGKMEVRIYQPINNQIAVRGLEDASKEVLSTLSIADLNTFFDFSEYAVDVLEVVETDGVSTYLLQVDTDDEVLHVGVRSDTWFPHEVSVIEGEPPGTLVFSNVVIDPDLSLDELTYLPRAKEVRM
ncbi:MAG: hypothetical protein M0R49_07970 [Limnochordia bacterium]|nr:hypothetical protein [Limnochordia bacterium]